MDQNRKTAYLTLKRIGETEAYSNLALAHEIQKNTPDNPAFVRELVLGVLTWEKRLDYFLRQLVKKGFRKLPLSVLTILRIGAYEILMMEDVPDYAAVNESVVLARKFAGRHASFVNGVLRNLVRQKATLRTPETETDPVVRLAEGFSYEEEIVWTWLDAYGEERTKSLLQALNGRRPLYVTCNTLKITPEEFPEKMAEYGLRMTPSEFSPVSFRAEGSGILQSRPYEEGGFYLQDPASVLAVTALDPQKGDRILDVCSAPGGKSKMAAVLTEGDSKIFAFDVYPKKAEGMQREFERLGMTGITAGVRDAASPEPGSGMEEGSFDRVICDVPCSGLGVIARRPEIKYKKLSGHAVNLPDLQYTILEQSAKQVRPGGRILYSTCTIRSEENEAVSARFLAAHPEFRKISEMQRMPDTDGTDGFYDCVMERNMEPAESASTLQNMQRKG